MDIVLLFPGQGSQKPGMGKDVAEAYPAARAVFERADEALGTSLSTLCFEGPNDQLMLTHNAQPALLTHSAAVWACVRDLAGSSVVAAAGHSLGEFTAYLAAESLHLDDAVRLVRRRGELMNESGKRRPGAMAAIIGELKRPIEEICAEVTAQVGTVVPANYNTPAQVVISGEESAVERANAVCKASGAKHAIRLRVSGAFHTPLMEPAADGLAEALDTASFTDPHFPVYTNVNAEPVLTAARATRLLLQQLTSPVRWVDQIRAIATRFPKAVFVEIGPGHVLTGLVKTIVPGAMTTTCGTATEVELLRELTAA